ncbi:MAG: L-glutamate gamma-semialdehyde dehydrogenase [Proteobacteria bacterium]|nr:L-glutamate gamma-semialdehyde dehydrogenase [Pseudomonadota bacterium]
MFKNEALLDFTVADNRSALAEALNRLHAKLKKGPLLVGPVIGGHAVNCAETVESVDPADPEITIGSIGFASVADATKAVQIAKTATVHWAAKPYAERAQILRAAADSMRKRKFDLSALIIHEAGKPWAEADADVAEAIDFCDYYADEMDRLGPVQRTSALAGEDNVYFYQPRGVVVVIAPWNFPLAIACGMVAAALVTGNTVVLKPAEQTSVVAYELMKILFEAGVPGDALGFVPGWGESVGRALVASPDVDMIVFTGSKAVGLEIIRRAGDTSKDQRNIKKVVAELGGKNAIIIDEDADLDEAVKGTLQSAFGYAGQKCSACSRAIVVGDAYEPFLKRLADAAQDIIVGAPKDSATQLGPVIDEDTQKRIVSLILESERSEKLLFRGEMPEQGFFVPATIFRDAALDGVLWNQEIFGPVLACRQVRSFDEALALANDSQYALTGGVYSRSPSHLERARREFKVGNLYLNRKITGALVCRQPFGGFRMSGVGSKAGGPDYLIQFMEPRSITENTMRRGFAPEV